MRIIGGYYKGRKILEPIDKSTRPPKDMVRESIFNIIEHSKLTYCSIKKESNILDLYSGVGSFGLECLSRGAKEVYFVEKHGCWLRYHPSFPFLWLWSYVLAQKSGVAWILFY